ncbi:MAG: hypothetical protein ABWZ25_01140 [Chitinophagaceae bacterium]
MKKLLAIVSAAIVLGSCAGDEGRYTNLKTGKAVELEEDPSGTMVEADTKIPVYIYVDRQSLDTFYGRTGEKINGKLVKTVNGEIKYIDDLEPGDLDGELKIKNGDYKMKVDADGDIKVKDGDTTTKIDGKTGEKKVKTD